MSPKGGEVVPCLLSPRRAPAVSVVEGRLTIKEETAMPKFHHFSYTSLSDYQQCQRKFYFKHVRRLEPPMRQLALEFGSAWHAAMHTWHLERDQAKALAVFKEKFQDDPNDALRTQATAARMLKNYVGRYAQEPFTVVGSEEYGEFTAGGFLFVFRTDKRILWDKRPWLLEHKTTKYLSYTYFSQFKPNLQCDMYLIGAREQWGIPYHDILIDASWVGTEGTKKKLEEQHVRDTTNRTDSEAEEAKKIIVDLATEITGKETFEQFIPNFGSCAEFGGCPFKAVCGAPPDARERIIEAEFRVKPPQEEVKNGRS